MAAESRKGLIISRWEKAKRETKRKLQYLWINIAHRVNGIVFSSRCSNSLIDACFFFATKQSNNQNITMSKTKNDTIFRKNAPVFFFSSSQFILLYSIVVIVFVVVFFPFSLRCKWRTIEKQKKWSWNVEKLRSCIFRIKIPQETDITILHSRNSNLNRYF